MKRRSNKTYKITDTSHSCRFSLFIYVPESKYQSVPIYIIFFPLLSFRLTYGFDFFMRLISTPLSRHKFRNYAFRGFVCLKSTMVS